MTEENITDIELHKPELIELDYRKVKRLQGDLTNVSEENYDKLYTSLKENGNFVPSYVWKKGKSYFLLDGHSRHLIYNNENLTFSGGYVIPYLLIQAKNEKEAKKKLLLIKSNYGKVTELGFKEFTEGFEMDKAFADMALSFDGFTDFDFLESDFKSGNNTGGSEDGNDDGYSRKVQSPVYEPKNEKPEIKDLVNRDRHDQLIKKIEKTKLPEEEKAFLIDAAKRHLSFDYQRIADYYAHSDKKTQKLMEESALVIIDFKQAIELGYVKLADGVAQLYDEDYGDEE